MPRSKCETLTDDEAELLLCQLALDGEVTVAKLSGVHRQTLNRAANKRRLYSRPLSDIRDYLRGVSPSRVA